jgi:predicted dehydrogenase
VRSPVAVVDAVGVSVFGEHEDVASARLHFANGCVANVTASRSSAAPCRRMCVWAPEGYARVDFGKRRLLLVQPSEELRQDGLDPRRLDPASLARLKEELFTRHFHTLDLDCNEGDQLTRELRHFVECVQTGSRPRVSGADGCEAIALAERVLESIRTHHWDGTAGGPTGPTQVPRPLGRLFQPRSDEQAA